jgi:hypothetical protein
MRRACQDIRYMVEVSFPLSLYDAAHYTRRHREMA